jgi:hypothetical protein
MRIGFSFAFFNCSLKHHLFFPLGFSIRIVYWSHIKHISKHQLKHYIFVNFILTIIYFIFRFTFLLQQLYLLLLSFQLILQLSDFLRLLLVILL